MKTVSIFSFLCIWSCLLTAQSLSISGVMQENSGEGLPFTNVALYDEALETLIKVEVTDDKGAFTFRNLPPKVYQLKASYVGFKDITKKIGSGVTPKGGSSVYVDEGVVFLRSQNVYDDGLKLLGTSKFTLK